MIEPRRGDYCVIAVEQGGAQEAGGDKVIVAIVGMAYGAMLRSMTRAMPVS